MALEVLGLTSLFQDEVFPMREIRRPGEGVGAGRRLDVHQDTGRAAQGDRLARRPGCERGRRLALDGVAGNSRVELEHEAVVAGLLGDSRRDGVRDAGLAAACVRTGEGGQVAAWR